MPSRRLTLKELKALEKKDAGLVILGTAYYIAEEHRQNKIALVMDSNGKELYVDLGCIIDDVIECLRKEVNTSLFTRLELEELLVERKVGIYATQETEYPIALAQELAV